jgi:hypothetical protein
MRSDEWIARFRKRLEERGVDEEMVRTMVDGMAGVISENPAHLDESPEENADDEVFLAFGDEDDD